MAEFQFYIVTKLVGTHLRKFKIEADNEPKARLIAHQEYDDGGLGECLSETQRVPGAMTRILKDGEK